MKQGRNERREGERRGGEGRGVKWNEEMGGGRLEEEER